MSKPQSKRSATRYPYAVDAQCVYEDQAFACRIDDISTSGVQITTQSRLNENEQISLAWEDPEQGAIEGQFYVIRAFQKTELPHQICYGLRYYQLDAQTKQNVLAILNRLRNIKVKEVETISLGQIYTSIDQGRELFVTALQDPSKVHRFFSEPIGKFKPYEKKALLDPNDPFSEVIADFVIYGFYCSLLKNVVSFCLKKNKRLSELLHRCVEILDHIDQASAKEDALLSYIEPLENKDELRLQYNESANRVFYAKQAMMEKIVKGLDEQTLLPELEKNFKKIQEQYDYTIELTNPNLQVDDIHTVSKKPPPKKEENQSQDPYYIPDFSKKKYGKKLFLVTIIVLFGLAHGWMYFSSNQRANQYKEALTLPIPIQKIEREGSQLYLYCDPAQWKALGEQKEDEIRSLVRAFIAKDPSIKTVVIRTGSVDMKMLITSLE